MVKGLVIEDLPNKTLLTPDEVAKFFSVTKRTVLNWCAEGKLESVKIGQVLRIYRVSVISYIVQQQEIKEKKIKRKYNNWLRGW